MPSRGGQRQAGCLVSMQRDGLHIMGDKENAHAFVLQAAEQFKGAQPGDCIQDGGWLVGDQCFRMES